MADQLIESPTYLAHVRHFFDDIDLEHMNQRGIDLSTYNSLKNEAIDVYFQTKPPNANIPPDPMRKWSQERSDTFLNWIQNQFPLGEAVPQSPSTGPASRIRKDVREVAFVPDEVTKLKAAFEGLMQRNIDDPNNPITPTCSGGLFRNRSKRLGLLVTCQTGLSNPGFPRYGGLFFLLTSTVETQ